MFSIFSIHLFLIPLLFAVCGISLLTYITFCIKHKCLWRVSGFISLLFAPILLGATYTGLPIALTNSSGIFALTNYPSWQYFAVLRLGVNTIGDAPAQWFIPTSTTCSISGGDIGSENPTKDGGCFNADYSGKANISEWGAQSGQDISTAFSNAITWAQNNGGGTIEFSSGQYTILHGQSITGNNVNLVGPTLSTGNFGFSWPWNSSLITWAPSKVTISCQDASNPCILFSGNSLTIKGLNFTNPQPPPPTSGTWTPNTWPYVFQASGNSWNSLDLENLTFTAADYCINLQGAGNYNDGPQGFNIVIRDIYFNGCWNTGIRMQQIDQTIKLDTLQYTFWWGQNNAAVLAYVEANKIDMDFCYAANPQINNVEFFESQLAMRFTNCTVSSGFGNLTFALSTGQMHNISFNEVCQGMSINGNTTYVTLEAENILAYGDTSTDCPVNSPIFFNFASNQANVNLSDVFAGFVQSLISLGDGGGGTSVLNNISIDEYSAFASGGSAILLSSGAEMSLNSTPFNALRPASEAGGIVGPGVSGQGTLYQSQIGSCTTGVEGCVITSAGSGSSGASMSFYENGLARDGYIQAFDSMLNLSTDSQPLNLNPGGSAPLKIQGTSGVTCSGTPSSSYATKLGIVTHC